MVLRKGSTVELLENFVKGLVGMEAGERSGEKVTFEVNFSSCLVEEHSSNCISCKLANFNNFLRMPVDGFEKRSFPLCGRLRRGLSVFSLGVKRKLTSISWFERDLSKLGCLVNYKSSTKKKRATRVAIRIQHRLHDGAKNPVLECQRSK